MTDKTLDYALDQGYINNWLVAGPMTQENADHSSSGPELSPFQAGFPANVADVLHEEPVDRGKATVDGQEITWRYYRCQADHLVGVAGNAPTLQTGGAWAYARVVLTEEMTASLRLWSDTLAEVWLNGVLVCQKDAPGRGERLQTGLKLAAVNDIAIQFAWKAAGAYIARAGLQIVPEEKVELLEQGRVQLNTQAKYPARQQIMEETLEKAYLAEVVNHRGAHFNLHWAEDASEEIRYAYQVQDQQERIYVEGSWDVEPGKALDIGHTVRLFERPYQIVLRSPGREYYEMGMRYQRSLPLYVLDNAYSSKPYGSYGARHTAALEDAARRDGDLFAEIAKMALGRWEKLDWKAFQTAGEQIVRREPGSESLLLGGLGLLYRQAEQAEFSPEAAEWMRAAALAYDYRPELHASESRAAIALACAALAGQKFAADAFTSPALSGEALCGWAEEKLAVLLRAKGQQGFVEWSSDGAYERWIVALSHLAGLAENEPLAELAAAVLDKILFLLAVNSFKGSLATAQAETGALEIKSGQLKACAGVQRMLWGMGVYTRNIQGVVSLACSEYEFPSFLADLAVQSEEEWLSREAHLCQDGTANLVVYKTPDFALSSVQDFCPGTSGGREHTWQATLGSEAVVFTTHPAGMQDVDAPAPGFWVGNGVRPRVAQWYEALVALYRLPADDWVGFTHAYFPVHSFDEYRIENGWAFAAKGSAFLAITAQQGLTLTAAGLGASCELRSYGRENAWVCLMGSAAQYEDFRAFQKKIEKLPLAWTDGGVRVQSPRGNQLEFGWQGDLLVDGAAQAISGFKAVDNPYCQADPQARTLDLTFQGLVLRLNFE